MLSVLKSKRKLSTIDKYKHRFIGIDFTITQRLQYNSIEQQLDAIKQIGDKGWYIKFIQEITILTGKKLSRIPATATTTSYNNVNRYFYKHSIILSDYYKNTRSFNNKLTHLTCNIPCNCYDFLIFTETRLNPDVLDSKLELFNYNIFKCNRSGPTSICRRWGSNWCT